MPNPAEACTVTALQVAAFAGHANDARVVREARQIALVNNVDPDFVRAITYEPQRGPKKPRLTFTVYDQDPTLDREPGDVLTLSDIEVVLKGELPTWWPQAAKFQVEGDHA